MKHARVEKVQRANGKKYVVLYRNSRRKVVKLLAVYDTEDAARIGLGTAAHNFWPISFPEIRPRSSLYYFGEELEVVPTNYFNR